MAGRRRWQDQLSVDRFTPDELLTRDLQQQRLQQQISQAPLQQQLKEFQLTRAQSAEAKAQYDMNKEIQTDRQKAAFYNGLPELENGLAQMGHQIGSRGHAEAFASYAGQFPLARSSSDIQETLKTHGKIADDQAAFDQRLRQFAPPPEKIAERYSLLQGSIIQHQTQAKAELAAKLAGGTIGKNTFTKGDTSPYSGTAALLGNQFEARSLEQNYPTLLSPEEQAKRAAVKQAVQTVQQPSVAGAAVQPTPIAQSLVGQAATDANQSDLQSAIDAGRIVVPTAREEVMYSGGIVPPTPEAGGPIPRDQSVAAAPVAAVTPTVAAPPAPTATPPPPDVTADQHAALKSGQPFWWKGQQLTKQ
jgi:hypothetical protein